MAFDPEQSLLALLSDDGVIQYWHTALHTLVATTQKLTSSPRSIDAMQLHKRLAFCQGQLIAAMNDMCVVVNVPHNNLFEIYSVLYDQLPKDVARIIMRIIADNITDSCALSYLDLAALLQVTRVQKPTIAEHNTSAVELETETKYINALYQEKVRPSINDEMSDWIG
jgi:hypothetical protein